MWSAQSIRFEQSLGDDRTEQLASNLGVSADSLRQLRAGWDGEAFSFPEVDGAGVVVGIERRFPDDTKRFHVGGHRGIKVPGDLAASDGPVLIVEGASDVAAALSRGLVAVGRPSAAQGAEHLAKLLEGRRVVVVGENDQKADGSWPGRDGAQRVARELAARWRRPVAWALPPPDQKDLRAWLGARADLDADAVLEFLREGATTEQAVAVTTAPTSEPRPFGAQSQPEPFPLDALPHPLDAFAEEVARVVHVDPAVPAIVEFVVLSGAVGNAFRVRVSRTHVEPNLSRFALVGAASGERKSAVFKRMLAPFDEWARRKAVTYANKKRRADSEATFHRKRAERLEAQGAKASDPADIECLRREAEEAREKIPAPPRPPKPYVGDVTSEALTRELALQGGATAVFDADARGLVDNILGRYRRDGAAADDVYLKAHGGDPIDRLRVGTGPDGERISVTNPALALCGLLQPDKLGTLASRGDLLSSGFLPRCVLALPRSLVGTRLETGEEMPFEESVSEVWERMVLRLYEERWRIVDAAEPAGADSVELVLSLEAQDARRRFANELELRQAPGSDLAPVAGFASKAAGEAARLAGLLHLALLAVEDRLAEAADVPIAVDVWRAAERCQRWCLSETLRTVGVLTEQEDARRAVAVLSWAARDPEQRSRLQARDLTRSGVAALTKVEEAERLLGLLVDFGWAEPSPPERSPQWAPRWTIHPRVFGGGRPWECDAARVSVVGEVTRQTRQPDKAAPLVGLSALSGDFPGEVRSAIDRFRRDHPILEVVGGARLARAGSTNGGEHHGPCPRCGGTDRLRAFPTPSDGSAPSATCRRCGHPGTGDALDWSIGLGGEDPVAAGARGRFLRARGYLASTNGSSNGRFPIGERSFTPAAGGDR